MQTLDERRREIREFPSLRGPAIADTGTDIVHVQVANVSHAGLMIELTESVSLPASFMLLFGDARQACELRWRNGAFAGVRLTDAT